MRRAWLVMSRDVRAKVGTRSFLLSNLLMPPLLVFGALATVGLLMTLETRFPTTSTQHRLVLVDEADGLGARTADFVRGARVEVIEVVTMSGDLSPLDALDVRVRDGDLEGWVRVDHASQRDGSYSFHGKQRPRGPVREEIREALLLAILEREWQPEGGRRRVEELRAGGGMRWVDVDDAREVEVVVTEAIGKLGGGALFLMLVVIPVATAAGVTKEQQPGLIDLIDCSMSSQEVVIGKTGAALATGLAAACLWSVSPSLLAVFYVTTAQGFTPTEILLGLLTAEAHLPRPSAITAWMALAMANAIAMSFLMTASVVASSGEERAGGLGGFAVLFVMAGSFFAAWSMDAAMSAPDEPWVILSSMVPVVGSPLLFARYAVGAPAWQAAAGTLLPLLVVVPASLALLRVSSAVRALGHWPRSLPDLRRAWRA